jgi:hypothetical protein
MKKYLLLLCNLILTVGLLAQQKDATYKNGNDSLAFTGDKAFFSITGFAGLSTAQVGEGSYEQLEHFMLVKTVDYSGPKSVWQATDSSRKDSCFVKVVDSHNYPIRNILVEACTDTDKVLEAKVTGDDGEIWFRENDKLEKIKVSALGYDAVSADYTTGKQYLITMTEHDIIENNTVVFTIRTIDDETISLLLLTDNFKEGKNRLSDLEKLEKKIRKRNPLEKRMKKVYVPYVRKI